MGEASLFATFSLWKSGHCRVLKEAPTRVFSHPHGLAGTCELCALFPEKYELTMFLFTMVKVETLLQRPIQDIGATEGAEKVKETVQFNGVPMCYPVQTEQERLLVFQRLKKELWWQEGKVRVQYVHVSYPFAHVFRSCGCSPCSKVKWIWLLGSQRWPLPPQLTGI